MAPGRSDSGSLDVVRRLSRRRSAQAGAEGEALHNPNPEICCAVCEAGAAEPQSMTRYLCGQAMLDLRDELRGGASGVCAACYETVQFLSNLVYYEDDKNKGAPATGDWYI
eukprot:TRINITY_DN45110_c0_g1_i2.p1 TRINITY_DN45110_c0_g1~~TRINITY_DN45110_c0_g1_i2.p1  ORF type:complete len:111 (-),score=11.46 TRINITY_DN45110_c0_g1_i2:221-553(-)